MDGKDINQNTIFKVNGIARLNEMTESVSINV